MSVKSIKANEPLWAHTTFKIGGPARSWAQPQDSAELMALLGFAKENALPVFIIGKGSNVLASDEGFCGLVLKLDSPSFSALEFSGSSAIAGAGVLLSELCSESARNGLSGFEHLFGIPGTVGGALAGNAGSRDGVRGAESVVRGIGELAEEVEVMDGEGKTTTLKKQELEFGYRHSNLVGYVILRAKFRLSRGERAAIENKMREVLERRRQTQELSMPSAGCVFKNPNGHSAGELIDRCGLKGLRMGDAAVSRKHANFIINLGSATCSDVRSLIAIIKERVRSEHGVSLKEEIKVIGGEAAKVKCA